MRWGVFVFLSWLFLMQAWAGGKPFWKAQLPGGRYMVSLQSIESLSVHTFLVDGVGQVTEMTVAIHSGVVARFYSISAPDVKMPGGIGQSIMEQAKEKANEVLERVGPVDALKTQSTMVVKNYPETTHAHTVEYRLRTPEEVVALFVSLSEAWENSKETSFEVK